MGQDQSKTCPNLAEKRYKVDRSRPKRRGVSLSGASPGSANRRSQGRLGSYPMDGDSDGCNRSQDTPPSEETSEERKLSSCSTSTYSRSPKTSVNSKHFLSRRERILIEQSWKKTRKTGSEHIGTKIFFMVLTADPEIKAIHGLEKIPPGRLKYDPRFRQHAVVFTRTFDYVVKNLEYPEKLESHFEALGRRHVAYKGRGFDPSYWETFAECMTQAAVEWEANRQRPTLGAWRTLISNIISFMRRGFDEDNAKRRISTLIPSSSRRAHLHTVHPPRQSLCPRNM